MRCEKQALYDLQYIMADLLKFIKADGSYSTYLAASNAKLAKLLIDAMLEERGEKLQSSVYVFDENNECVRHFIA